MESSKSQILPAFFLSHGGGPCFWMEWNPPDSFDQLAALFRGLASTLPERPKAVLVISAHWEEDAFTVQSTARPQMIYDYYGFPENTYELQYPAPGSPALAARVQGLLEGAAIPVKDDSVRGFDHGVYVPFLLIYPDADIPVVQLSLRRNLDPAEHYRVGQALAPLRKEGILLVGSGLSYHNLSHLRDTREVSLPFDRYLGEAVELKDPEQRKERLLAWKEAPNARLVHPREDHLVPLFVIAGAAGADAGQVIYREKMKNWGFWTSSYRFG
jgi:aromatic ring-opening dioxygenase catalytic subunit (LigB family)